MYGGEIVERGPAEEVTQQPAHPYTQLLVASAPDPDNLGSSLKSGNAVQGPRPPPGSSGTSARPRSAARSAARCPLADDQCRREDPALQLLSPARAAACWRLDVPRRPAAGSSKTGSHSGVGTSQIALLTTNNLEREGQS